MSYNDIPAYVRKEIEAYYLLHRDRIYDYVHARISDEDVVEDITQDVFLVTIRRYKKFVEHENKVGWLFKVADYRMKEYEKKVTRLVLYDEEEMPGTGLEERGYELAELEILAKSILTPEEQELYWRRNVWGEELDEIAAKENISNVNVRVRLSRIRKKFRKAMEDKKRRR